MAGIVRVSGTGPPPDGDGDGEPPAADSDPPQLTRGAAIGIRRGFAFAFASDEPALALATVYARRAGTSTIERLGALLLRAQRGLNVRRVPVGLVPGIYYIALRARDAAGNTTPGAFLLRFVVR